jgi:Family of unknown function (DUF6152)
MKNSEKLQLECAGAVDIVATIMKARSIAVLLSGIVMMAFTTAALAHHSISAEFDSTRRITLSGTLTKVAWGNPHSFFYLEVKDAKSGAVVTWACELGSPNMLATLGWTHSTLRVGMIVSLTGILARDGSHKVIARNLVADGNKLIAWPSERSGQ